MQAIVFSSYGPPDVLHLADLPEPIPGDDDMLVRVHATTVTPGDWRMRRAIPFAARLYNGLFRPRRIRVLGFEYAGEVTEVGSKVSRFRQGDSVYGRCGFEFGAYAEYKTVPESALVALKPANLSFEQAAAVPLGGLAALNLLRKGAIETRERVLVYGASGSVGSYAVQLARHFGARVTAVCSTANLDWVQALGAADVIDYTQEDVRQAQGRFDLVLDAVGHMVSGYRRSDFGPIIAPEGTFVSVEMDRRDRIDDLLELTDLVEAGEVKPVIDRRYPMAQIAEAHRYVEQGHKKGNVVVSIGDPSRAPAPPQDQPAKPSL